jgi:hypothetical protein
MCHLVWLLSRKYGTVWYHPASSKLCYLTALSFVNFQEKLTGTSSLLFARVKPACSACCVFGARCTFCINTFYSYFPFTFFLLHFSLFLSLPPLLHRKPSILIHLQVATVVGGYRKRKKNTLVASAPIWFRRLRLQSAWPAPSATTRSLLRASQELLRALGPHPLMQHSHIGRRPEWICAVPPSCSCGWPWMRGGPAGSARAAVELAGHPVLHLCVPRARDVNRPPAVRPPASMYAVGRLVPGI